MSDHPSASADFWHDRWATRQIGFHEGRPNLHLVRHWPAKGGRVLVPLAGKSHDLEWLAAQGHEVTGVELSPVACEAFFAERGWTPEVRPEGRFTRWSHGAITLLQGDIFDLEGVWDAAWDRAAMVALPPAVRRRYAASMRERVAGPTVLVTFVYDQARRDGPPFSVPDAEVRALHPEAVVLHREAVDDEKWQAVGGVEEVVWLIDRTPG